MQSVSYDRSAIMKAANKLVAQGVSRKVAMKQAWDAAKEGRARSAPLMTAPAHQCQPGGARAALRRYGVETEAITRAARRFARQTAAAMIAVAAAAVRPENRLRALPRPLAGREIELRRGADGVYRHPTL